MKTFLSTLAMVFCVFFSAIAQENLVQSVSSVSVLVTLPAAATGLDIFCEGLASSGDGAVATGIYRYYPNDSTTTNTTGVFKPNDFAGRWKQLGGLGTAAANVLIDYTIASGTGGQAINKPAGRIKFAADGTTTSLTVTNSLVTTNSLVLATLSTNDATATSVSAASITGKIILTINRTNTATLPCAFLVINK